MPKATVAAIITKIDNEHKKILLTLRNSEPYKGFWCLPGGHIDPYESAYDAMVREVKEETGLNFTPHFFDYFDEIIPKQEIHAVVIVFEGNATGSPHIPLDEILALRWFSLVEVRKMELAFHHNRILACYINKGEGGREDEPKREKTHK